MRDDFCLAHQIWYEEECPECAKIATENKIQLWEQLDATEGTILFDREHKEVFAFKKRRDYAVVRSQPERFERATQQQINQYGIKEF